MTLIGAVVGTGCAARGATAVLLDRSSRIATIRRAEVWQPVTVSAMNVRRGPIEAGGFPVEGVVDCTYVEQKMSGRTPKFTCALVNGDQVKVKYGLTNGELYAEVAATRLFWALGFGADAMFPVQVRCHDCPGTIGDVPIPPSDTRARDRATRVIRVAAIERKLPGVELADRDGSGWAWSELQHVPAAPAERRERARASRDALTLLAAIVQHTDSKREQQRLMCLGTPPTRVRTAAGDCERPFMLISDLGKTFGRANLFNRDGPGSVNLDAWRQVDVWLDTSGCRANVSRSATGTLENPVISEAGRAFLAGLLRQLTDRQLTDLFTVARFSSRANATGAIGAGETAEWVSAFKDKVRQVTERTCDERRNGE